MLPGYKRKDTNEDTNENEKILVYLNNKCYNNMNYPSIENNIRKLGCLKYALVRSNCKKGD